MPSASADSLSFGLICSAGAGSFVLFVCLLMVDDVGGSKHSKSARQAKQAGYTTGRVELRWKEQKKASCVFGL